jgi:hypothetical protein
MEQALVRFSGFVNDQEGNHSGDAYIALAKFLLDSRRGGSDYDQSYLPPGQRYGSRAAHLRRSASGLFVSVNE